MTDLIPCSIDAEMQADASPMYPLQIIAAHASDQSSDGSQDAHSTLLNVCHEVKAKAGMADTFRSMLSKNADVSLQSGVPGLAISACSVCATHLTTLLRDCLLLSSESV